MTQLYKNGLLAVLPQDWKTIYVVIPYREVRIRSFSDKRNIRTQGEYFILYWPESDSESKYHCTNCFATPGEAHERGGEILQERLKTQTEAIKRNMEQL